MCIRFFASDYTSLESNNVFGEIQNSCRRQKSENLWPLPNMKFGLWSFPAKGGVAKPNFSVSKGVINWPIKCLDNKCRCLTNKSDSHDLYVGKHQDYLL